MIDPNKKYRTRDGRPVRIYATDGWPFDIHGAWLLSTRRLWALDRWHEDGGHPDNPGLDLIEVTLAEELRDQIPWEALRPEWRYASMSPDGAWWVWNHKPTCSSGRHGWRPAAVTGSKGKNSDQLNMPTVDLDRWQETLIERPEDR